MNRCTLLIANLPSYDFCKVSISLLNAVRMMFLYMVPVLQYRSQKPVKLTEKHFARH